MMGGSMMNGPMMGHGASSPTVPGAREIAVTSTSFRFEPNEIHVRAAQDVTIVLAANDIAHDFTIDALGSMSPPPASRVVADFTPRRPPAGAPPTALSPGTAKQA